MPARQGGREGWRDGRMEDEGAERGLSMKED